MSQQGKLGGINPVCMIFDNTLAQVPASKSHIKPQEYAWSFLHTDLKSRHVTTFADTAKSILYTCCTFYFLVSVFDIRVSFSGFNSKIAFLISDDLAFII